MELRPKSCERAAEFVSLELDGELSLLERAILKRHLQRCEPCAVYARQITALTEMMRTAPAEQIRVQIDTWRLRRRVYRVLQSGAATAAVAAVAIWLGIVASGTPREHAPNPTVSPRSTAGAVSDDRYDWPAGLPRTVPLIQLFPGGLYTASGGV
jgi:anti-sigma factor RsiW